MNPDWATQLVADPLVQAGSLALIGALLTHIVLKRHPKIRLTGQIALFAALTLLLLHHGIVPYEPGPSQASLAQRSFIGLAKVVWWTNAALTLVGFVRIFLVFERQPREGRLIQDLAVGVIYVGATLSIIAYVFSFPVGTLIATSGVFAVIFGLALQSTLNDVFSGIALNIGRPYSVGDWIALDGGIEGRVIETNWRATHLLNSTNDLIILPNSNLAKATLTNLSEPDPAHGVKLTVRILPTAPPAIILNVMRDVLLSCSAVMPTPAPGVTIKSLDSIAVEVELSFHVGSLSLANGAKNDVFDLVYRHAKAAGLSLSRPPGAEGASALERTATAHRPTPLRLLDALPLFASLTDDEKETLAAAMTRRTYRKDQIVAEQGAVLASLMIVRAGVLVVSHHDDKHVFELSRLAPGDCFGEEGLLTGTGEIGSIRALTSVVVYEIAKNDLAPLMHDRPRIADELGEILARRAQFGQHSPSIAEESAGGLLVGRLTSRIRQLFHVTHLST